MLPLIGIVAIGLLLLAGRLFFTSDFHSDRDSLPVMARQGERPAGAEERAAGRISSTRVAEAPPILAVPDVVLAEPREEKKSSVSPEQRAPSVSSSVPSSKTKTSGGAVAPVHPKPKPALTSKPKVVKAPVPAEKKAAPPAKKPAPPQTISPQPALPQQKAQNSSGWKVQVGAFSMRSAADDVARQLAKDGRSAEVISGKTMHKVLIGAGGKDEASALAARMDRSGFPGAFVLSPGR
jgi:cell division protein FtsN